MSAWIVSTRHIDALVQAASRPGRYGLGPLQFAYAPNAPEDHEQLTTRCTNADEIGRMLLIENVASVAYRYPDDTCDELPGPTAKTPPNEYHYRHPGEFSAVEILKAIDCYEYQSCEHPAWRYSQAYAFCAALRDRVIRQLPGYDDAPWGIDGYETISAQQAA